MSRTQQLGRLSTRYESIFSIVLIGLQRADKKMKHPYSRNVWKITFCRHFEWAHQNLKEDET